MTVLDPVRVVDFRGTTIEVGARCMDGGVVMLITDPDGDVDGEGRRTYTPPYVHVSYVDFEDAWPCSWSWVDDEWVCYDVEVINEEV